MKVVVDRKAQITPESFVAQTPETSSMVMHALVGLPTYCPNADTA